MHRRPRTLLLAAALLLLGGVLPADPAVPAVPPRPVAQATPVQTRDIQLSASASCSQGDVEIFYAGQGLDRQTVRFSSEDGRDLHRFDVGVYAPVHDGREYILSQTRTPPPAGTVVAVYVTIGESPANPDTTGEFFLAYRCDTQPSSAGGTNTVIETCVGLVGTCPQTAQSVARPTEYVSPPRFTG